MTYIKQRIYQLNTIIAGSEGAAKSYYMGRRDELKLIMKKMKNGDS